MIKFLIFASGITFCTLAPSASAQGCPNLTGHWVSYGGLSLNMAQKDCAILSDDANTPGFHHTVRGTWDAAQYSFSWIMARVDQQGCETHLYGRATVTGPKTFNVDISSTEGRCGLSPKYTEHRTFTLQ